jgi:hypothetical protein
MKSRIGYIYGLCHPDTGKVSYVGKSINPKRRFMAHIRKKSLMKPTLKNNWIKSLQAKGKNPTLKILHKCSEELLDQQEIIYISKYRKLNPKLKNMTDGGEGCDTTNGHSIKSKIVFGSSIKNWPKVKRFKSMSAAARFIKGDQCGILKSINHEIKNTHGWFFSFSLEGLYLPSQNRNISKRSRTILCSNGKEYTSVTQASEMLKISSKQIWKVLKSKNKTNGLHFWVKGEEHPSLKKPAGISIFCNTTGQTFDNARIAAKELGLAYQSISSVLRGVTAQTKGFIFSYVDHKPSRRKNKLITLTHVKTNRIKLFTQMKDVAHFLGLSIDHFSVSYNKNPDNPIRNYLIKIKIKKKSN